MLPYYTKDQVNEIMTRNKAAAKSEFDSIAYVENKKKQRLKPEELENMLPKLKPKEEVFEEMKLRFKNSWKSPGYVNGEFNTVPVLKACALSSWQIDRMSLAERSYKCPPGDKGLKVKIHGSEFGEPSRDSLPPKYATYLDGFKEKYEEFRFRPSKYGKLPIDERTEKFNNRKKEPFKLTNSKQSNSFGFDYHSTWETELQTINATNKKTKASSSLSKVTL